MATATTAAEAAASSFADVFEHHHARALRLAYLHCGDHHRAEDAVSEAMANVYNQWRKGRVRDVGPYLRRAVVNQLHTRGRRASLERSILQRRWGDTRGQRTHAEQVTDNTAIVEALQQLPDRMRLAVVLRYFEDLSERDTAEVMGVSVGAVKSTTHRGIARLRELLDEPEEVTA